MDVHHALKKHTKLLIINVKKYTISILIKMEKSMKNKNWAIISLLMLGASYVQAIQDDLPKKRKHFSN